MTAPARGWIVTSVAVIAWLAIARPWTIRPIAEAPHGPFDATAYVATIWESRAVPAIRTRAVPFATFQAQHVTQATAVSLDATVVETNTRSRVGTAALDVSPSDGRADALLMIGPVLRGTALRDALDFIQFTDFTNQIQFAGVAAALNEHVLASALKDVTAAGLTGRHVQVLGVAWRESAAPDALPFVVPVQLSIGGRP
jgi:predicted lipoprotein